MLHILIAFNAYNGAEEGQPNINVPQVSDWLSPYI